MFVEDPPVDQAVQTAYDEDTQGDGYVNNSTRAWCWRPDVLASFLDARVTLLDGSSLAEREVAVLVASTTSARGDAYCSLAWGTRLAELSSDATAAAVLTGGGADELTDRERALAAWARAVVRDPNATSADDVARLRTAGLSDREVVEATMLVSMRLAFSTVNDALGALPDHQLGEQAPAAVRAAVTFGRPVGPAG